LNSSMCSSSMETCVDFWSFSRLGYLYQESFTNEVYEKTRLYENKPNPPPCHKTYIQNFIFNFLRIFEKKILKIQKIRRISLKVGYHLWIFWLNLGLISTPRVSSSNFMCRVMQFENHWLLKYAEIIVSSSFDAKKCQSKSFFCRGLNPWPLYRYCNN